MNKYKLSGKWDKFFTRVDLSKNDDVVFGLATLGLIQLHLINLENSNPTSTSGSSSGSSTGGTTGSISPISANSNRFENQELEATFRKVGFILHKCCRHRDVLSNEKLSLRLKFIDWKVDVNRLRNVLNTIKLSVAGSRVIENQFNNSSFRFFIQMVDELFIQCPWSKSNSASSASPNANVYSFVDEYKVITNQSFADEEYFPDDMRRSVATFISINELVSNLDLENGTTQDKIPCTNTNIPGVGVSSELSSGSKRRAADDDLDISASNVSKRRKIQNEEGASVNHENTEIQKQAWPVTVEDKLFATDLVMEKLFSLLEAETLLSCRAVSHKFSYYANQALHRSDSFKIQFKYGWRSQNYLRAKSSKSKCGIQRKLTELTAFLRTCSSTHSPLQFPCSNFSFIDGTLISEDLQDFLESYGSQVLKLHLVIEVPVPLIPVAARAHSYSTLPPMSISILKNLLLHQASFINTLELESFPQCWFGDSNNYYLSENNNGAAQDATNVYLFPLENNGDQEPEPVKLKHLKTLRLLSKAPVSILQDLFDAATNLKCASGPFNVQEFIQLNKFHLIKQLMWNVSLDEGSPIEDYSRLLEDSIEIHSQLVEFGIYFTSFPSPSTADPFDENDDNDLHPIEIIPNLSRVLLKILQKSAGSLKIFNVLPQCLHMFCGPATLRIPQLPKVREIVFHSCPDNMAVEPDLKNRYLPRGIDLQSTFPNLYKVTISFPDMIPNDPWSNYFEVSYKYKAVRTVKFIEIQENCHYFPMGWMVQFAGIFPDVEIIEVNTPFYHFPDTAQALWRFVHLKSLQVKINIRPTVHLFPAIDQAFTGMSESQVETTLELLKVLEKTRQLDRLESANRLAVENRSIGDLKELRRLKIIFVDLEPYRAHLNKILTEVTGRFGFALCPQLKVCLEVEGTSPNHALKLLKLLEPIHPFVHIHLPNGYLRSTWWLGPQSSRPGEFDS